MKWDGESVVRQMSEQAVKVQNLLLVTIKSFSLIQIQNDLLLAKLTNGTPAGYKSFGVLVNWSKVEKIKLIFRNTVVY